MSNATRAPAPDVDAERLNKPLGARYVDKHSHNQYAGISRANLVHLMNRLFGPHGWRNEVLRNEIVQDEVLPPAPGGDERLARYVSATAIVRVTARTTHGEIVRDGMGVASQARMLDARPKGPGTRGSDALQMAVLGAATSALKHACYLIGRTLGGELGELGYRELQERAAQSGEPDAAHAPMAFDRALHDRQPARVLALSKWYSARVRDAASRQEAEAAAQGAMEKLLEAGAQREAAAQVVAALKEGVAKKPLVADVQGSARMARPGGRRQSKGDGTGNGRDRDDGRRRGEGAGWPGVTKPHPPASSPASSAPADFDDDIPF